MIDDFSSPSFVIPTVELMRKYGGNFVRILADLIVAADPENKKLIFTTWPQLIEKYGPDSQFAQIQDNG